jgi:hypothetical protein
LLAVAHHTRHGRLTGGLFAVAQHLRQKRPDHHGDRVDPIQAKQAAMLGEHALDPFGRQNLGKRQPLAGQKCVGDSLKTATASPRRTVYVSDHEKPSLALFAEVLPRRASSS